MSSSDSHRRVHERSLEKFPKFDLDCQFDDPEAPQVVRLFPGGNTDEGIGPWITIDIDHAIPLDEVV